MGLYQRYVLPRLIDLACGVKPALRQRHKIVPLASGRVLEVGAGSGLNLPLYDRSRVSLVWGLEPAPEIWALGTQRLAQAQVEVEFIEADAEQIPLPDRSADTVLLTYTLCTIARVAPALAEMHRVLKDDGRLIFCEHGKAPDAAVSKWQDRLNPLWRRLAGGCNLNRPIPALLAAGGFTMASLETMYLPGFRPLTFNYWGHATKRRLTSTNRPITGFPTGGTK